MSIASIITTTTRRPLHRSASTCTSCCASRRSATSSACARASSPRSSTAPCSTGSTPGPPRPWSRWRAASWPTCLPLTALCARTSLCTWRLRTSASPRRASSTWRPSGGGAPAGWLARWLAVCLQGLPVALELAGVARLLSAPPRSLLCPSPRPRRYNYTTPKSYLELISLYKQLLERKRQELRAAKERLQNGVEKIAQASAQVGRWALGASCCLQRGGTKALPAPGTHTTPVRPSSCAGGGPAGGAQGGAGDRGGEEGRHRRAHRVHRAREGDGGRGGGGEPRRRGGRRQAAGGSHGSWMWGLGGAEGLRGPPPPPQRIACLPLRCKQPPTSTTTTLPPPPPRPPPPQTEVLNFQEECTRDLAAAEPIIAEAEAALNSLDKASLGELKSFGSPAAEVVQVRVPAARLGLLPLASSRPRLRSSGPRARVLMLLQGLPADACACAAPPPPARSSPRAWCSPRRAAGSPRTSAGRRARSTWATWTPSSSRCSTSTRTTSPTCAWTAWRR
jgi:hypothetical protein